VSDSPSMISAPRLCPKCGMEIPADAPEEGCPGCLLENGLAPDRDGSVTVRDSSAAVVAWANADAVPDARHSKKAARAAETLGELRDTNCWKSSAGAVRAWYFAPAKRVSTAQWHSR
jgi:hypothetical protein